MRINRFGSDRFRKVVHLLDSDDVTMEWNEKYDEIQIEVRRADHPSDGKTHHDYLIFLSLDDLTKVIELAAGSGIPKCGRKMSRKLRRVRAELLKLLVCASGLALAQANNEPQKA